ncbi:7702_t:CDS:10, partial [Paraglomus occultum]
RKVAFTADKYPHIKRNPNFKEINDEDVSYLASILSQNALIVDNGTNSSDLTPFNVDWMGKYRGKSRVVVRPRSAEEVAKVLKYCGEKRIAVVPQGGNTGLVGGSVPVFDEIVISTNYLNKIRSFDPVAGILVSDAGCVLEVLDNHLAEHGYMMPLDLGAKGSCQVGGNVATNAGGLRFLRYGSLHGSVLGLEVVLPDGTILDNLLTLRKDNTGYDLKQLFIGSEGTLGIITGVSIATPKRPKAVNVAVFGLSSFEDVQKAFLKSKEDLTEILSAFEFWDFAALQLCQLYGTNRSEFPLGQYPFYVLMETSGSNKEHDDEKLAACLESLMDASIVQDGVIAQDISQMNNLWSFREDIPEATHKAGAVYKYDISLPVPVLYKMVEDMRKRLEDSGSFGKDKAITHVIGFGHLGDGNLHLNITAKEYDEDVTKLIEPYVYEWTGKYRGSISAEHGLGLMKANYLGYSKPKPMIELMRMLKKSIDPNGIMNPYKFLPN